MSDLTCKDCKHFREAGYILDEFAPSAPDNACMFFSDLNLEYDWVTWFTIKPEDYCSWGVRREK